MYAYRSLYIDHSVTTEHKIKMLIKIGNQKNYQQNKVHILISQNKNIIENSSGRPEQLFDPEQGGIKIIQFRKIESCEKMRFIYK